MMRQSLVSLCTGECIPSQVSILNGFGGVGKGQRRQNALISCRKIIVRAFLTLTSLPCSKLNFLIQISGPTYWLNRVQSKFACDMCFCSFILFVLCFQEFGQYIYTLNCEFRIYHVACVMKEVHKEVTRFHYCCREELWGGVDMP